MSMSKRKTVQVKAQLANTNSLGYFWGKLPQIYQVNFEYNYGKIIHLINVPVQVEAVTCLAQFFNAPLRCFTFRDFQLAPTIEELSLILKSSKKTEGVYTDIGRMPKIEDLASMLAVPTLPSLYKRDSEIKGFSRSSLEFLAQNMVEERKWGNLADTLALLVFGLVLFPNLENYIDNAAISVYWAARQLDKDYVPALLADIYYTLERKHAKKRGLMLCCIPLLYQWFTAQIFPRTIIIPSMDRVEWTYKIASLSEQTIFWHAFKVARDEVITSCGNFPNVPLIGSRGCINYNPLLALHQIGYPMFFKPDEASLGGFVIHNVIQEADFLHLIAKAWEQVHVRGSDLRARIGQGAESYKDWVRERAETVGLPFIVEASMPTTLPIPVIPMISLEEAEGLRAKIMQLEAEKEEVENQLHKTTFEKNQVSWNLQQEELKFKELQERFDQKTDRAGKLKTCLNQADSGLESLHEQLEKAQDDNGRWRLLWDRTLEERKEMRMGFECRILELTNYSKNPSKG